LRLRGTVSFCLKDLSVLGVLLWLSRLGLDSHASA
jgi:hypothetical protein